MASKKIDEIPQLSALNIDDSKNLLIIETDSGTRTISYKTLTKILNNKIDVAIGTHTTPKTLVAGTTEVTFTVDNINDNSTIRVEVADISTLSHRGIIVDGNNVTVKFEPQENDILVRLVVFNELEETDF